MSKEPKIPEELAQEQLDSLVELYDYVEPDEGSDIPRLDTPLLRHIMAGRIEVAEGPEDIQVVQHLRFKTSGKTKIEWSDVDGVAWTTCLSGSDEQSDYRFAAKCTKTDIKSILAMKGVDHKTMKDLVRFFAAAVM